MQYLFLRSLHCSGVQTAVIRSKKKPHLCAQARQVGISTTLRLSISFFRASRTFCHGKFGNQFDRMGVITLEKEKYADEETVMNMALEAGAEDVQDEGDVWEVRTGMGDFNTVREALESQGVEMVEAQLAMVPRMLNPIDAETAKKLVRLTDALEDLDDVQNVFTNADFPEDFDPEA